MPTHPLPRPLPLLAGLGLALALAVPASAPAQAPPSLSLSPSKVETAIAEGLRLGPFSLSNGTGRPYAVRAFAVMLRQARDGGIAVDDPPSARARAARTIGTDLARFPLPPGATRSPQAIVRRIPPEGSFYGGLLLEARPSGPVREQVVGVLRLNASLLLDPPAGRERVRPQAGGRARAEQAGPRRLRLLAPVRNAGNAYLEARGRVRVLDRATGRELLSRRLRAFRVLPGATVDLLADVAEPVPAGAYELRAQVRMGDRTARVRGEMRLSGANELEERRASGGGRAGAAGARPSLLSRIGTWIAGNAALLLALLGVTVLAAVAGPRYVRELKRTGR